MAARKLSTVREYFVALTATDAGETLLVETPASQAVTGSPTPATLRLNRAATPFEVQPEETVVVETDFTPSEKERTVSIVQTISFSGKSAEVPAAVALVQAGRGGALGKEVAEMARARLEKPSTIEVGSRWTVVDPDDMPNLARRGLLVTAVAADYVTVEITNEFGEFVDAGREIPTEWFSSRLMEVAK